MTTLLNSERFVVESFLKQADAALTFVDSINTDGLARVVRSATARDPGEDYNEMLDTLFEAEQDFREVKRAFRRIVRSVKAALEIDAELKNAEADQRSQEEVSERVARLVSEAEAFALSKIAYPSEPAVSPSFAITHFGKVRGLPGRSEFGSWYSV
ncbi:hypothetical protein FY136_28520 (plasmid) [Agrobacterium tumefaciens]|uniref:hypothetical protein n=1 Tax=Agrobacterium tumefaciens TaxID=358 RepID=UPI0021D1B68C|nr:hypothetical protein [Agrobacterium tumefaciens]UXT53208.1 hypothetical protein FY136_28520 [Agrobacterium tumefaciens]